MAATDARYTELAKELREVSLLHSSLSVLQWDEQTYMPHDGSAHRAAQQSLLAGIVHRRATSPRLGELLGELESADGLTDVQSANVREARRDYDRRTKLPPELVEELSRTASLAHPAWVAARQNSDFAVFVPWLEKIVDLKRQEAAALGSDAAHPYDPLLDEYEAHATTASVTAVFEPLRDGLIELAQGIAASSVKPDTSILTRSYPVDVQREFSLRAAEAIGFNFNAGRLDVAPHPFCSGFGPGDCRLTTRYDEHFFPMAFFGTLHEAGHGMYEQGLNADEYGTPCGESCSLGIHESQSLMWEAFVGRGRAFWRHFYEPLQQAFPEALGDVPAEVFHAATNKVEPSYIRVEADEVTYSLHIMLRFELEQALIAGELSPADVPGAWNETFEKYLGIVPPDDAQGCLQDIHWSGGGIGYFPTYALGKLYAAQFFAAAKAELGDLDEMFSRGEFRPLLDWLRKNIHRPGRQYSPSDLVERVTGNPLSHQPFLDHLHARFDELYEL